MLFSRLRSYTRPAEEDIPLKSRTLKRSNTVKTVKKSNLKRLVTFTAQRIDHYNKQCPVRTKTTFKKLKAAYAMFNNKVVMNKNETNQILREISNLQGELQSLKQKTRQFNKLKFTVQRQHNQLVCTLKDLLYNIL